MKVEVSEDHFLVIDGKPVKRDIIKGGSPMPKPLFLVEHFTGGADGDGDTDGDFVKDSDGAADVMRGRGVSAHLVIDRAQNGRVGIVQCRPFNMTAGHAGGRTGNFTSIWSHPTTGELFDGNSKGIGFEIANAGNSAGAIAWAKKHVGAKTVSGRHPNGGPLEDWEVYSDEQIEVVMAVSAAVVLRYGLVDVVGHDGIASWRKNDPGFAFPWERVRAACGFRGMPRVFSRAGRVIRGDGAQRVEIPSPAPSAPASGVSGDMVPLFQFLEKRGVSDAALGDLKSILPKIPGARYDKERECTMAPVESLLKLELPMSAFEVQ